MLVIIIAILLFVVFCITILGIFLSDTETFKAIDKKIAKKIEERF